MCTPPPHKDVEKRESMEAGRIKRRLGSQPRSSPGPRGSILTEALGEDHSTVSNCAFLCWKNGKSRGHPTSPDCFFSFTLGWYSLEQISSATFHPNSLCLKTQSCAGQGSLPAPCARRDPLYLLKESLTL